MTGTATARQFWVRAPGQGEIRSVPLAPPRGDQVLVRALYSGISRGTESLVFRGEVPASQYEVMRAPFQEGSFPAPVKYGYSSVGRVVAGPDAPFRSGPAEELVGRAVFCLHPHQDLYCVPAEAVAPIPEGLPPGRAVLAANMETALNALWDARPAPGDRVVVIGGGVVGMLAAWLCRQVPATRLTLVDPNPAREEVARALRLPFRTDPPAGADADLVMHASGDPRGLRDALAAAGVEAVVLELSWYGTAEVALPLGESFHSRRLTLKSSQVGRLAPERTPRWDHRRRLALALELLRSPELDVLVTGESPFEELPEVLARLSRGPGDALCHRIRYAERSKRPPGRAPRPKPPTVTEPR